MPPAFAAHADPFDIWRGIAAANVVSPVAAGPNDLSQDWTAPDGRTVHIVVKAPQPGGLAEVRLPEISSDMDAAPVFAQALQKIRQAGASVLNIPKGVYVFKSLADGGQGHLVLRDLKDVAIRGNGATFVFSQNKPGVFITGSQRLKIENLTIRYNLRTASLATVQGDGADRRLVIDPQNPVTAQDEIHYVSEYDPARRNWAQGGARVILPPDAAMPAIYEGHQTYRSPAFAPLEVGKTYIVFHHWYGGAAIRIEDQPGPHQAEDIILDHVAIQSAPGMGVVAYGLKRGLAIVDSHITPGKDDLVSTEYDAIHMLISGGDVLIRNNVIAGQGDDAINLNNAVHPVIAIDPRGRNVTLSTYSRFIQPRDKLAFFNEKNDFLGQAQVLSLQPLGGLENRIALDAPVSGLDERGVARDVALINSRFAVVGNSIGNCNCHGILVQSPNGIVADNVIQDTKYNAIRLLTNIWQWKEGAGAFNILVARNRIARTGADGSLPLPFGAISAYGAVRGGIAASPANADLEISDNEISDVAQACVTIASSKNVRVLRNICRATNLLKPGAPSIPVLSGRGVILEGNRREGESGGGIAVADGARDVRRQQNY